MIRMTTLAIALMLGASACGAAAPTDPPARTANCETAAGPFWKAFRSAALAEDAGALAGMARFPLETRGTLDDEPPGALDRAAFIAAVPELIAADTGLKEEAYPQHALIKATATPPAPSCADGGGSFTVGTMMFAYDAGSWKLARIYR
ncbi:hypothetical protein ABC347_16220 [Sphingomonas sp. 1P06PA]|uniref:hypothetical protein n=1 Tax=Sphingomonas sp. 1P06PA TaxID=554121 RepID=UPI0039A585AB